jgi:S-adenosylmethionine/arginine decarboxylase-like enzyme
MWQNGVSKTGLENALQRDRYMSAWGYHLALDCTKCEVGRIIDEANIVAFFDDVVPATGLQNLQTGPEHIRGISAVQFIATSSITCHFCDYTGDCYIDFFSCKAFDRAVVIDSVQRFFAPVSIKEHFLVRDA